MIHLCASLWEESSQSLMLPCAASTHKLSLQLGKRTELVGYWHLTAFVISTSLQPLLNIVSEKQRFHDGGSPMISGFIELMSNSFGRNLLFRC